MRYWASSQDSAGYTDLRLRADLLLADAPVLDENDLFAILSYLDKGSTLLDNEVARAALLRLVPNQTERIMGCITQPFYDQGKAEGKAEGRAEGKAEGEAQGEAKVLTRVLERRFGTLPAAVRQRIFAADVVAIEAWVERAFDAPDLQSIIRFELTVPPTVLPRRDHDFQPRHS